MDPENLETGSEEAEGTKVLIGLLLLMLVSGSTLFGFAIFYADAVSH